ncbi:MAG: DUF2067 domain-containing protein [Planctomycetota bacterium]|nr:DUF2067 domain-containing protein [Planctomycetota bacterium]
MSLPQPAVCIRLPPELARRLDAVVERLPGLPRATITRHLLASVLSGRTPEGAVELVLAQIRHGEKGER